MPGRSSRIKGPRRAPRGGALTCAVSKRVPRLYMENGKEVERSLRLLL